MSRALCLTACLTLTAVTVTAPACAESLYGGRAPRPGPDVLYAPAAFAPQLANTGIWIAPPILVSGTSAYRAGEFLYQDHLYDDRGAGDGYRYPADSRYAGNAADLVELRLRPLADELAFRLTYNTMIDPSLVGTTIALGGSAHPQAMPHGARAAMPAKVFLTVHGSSADVVDAASGATLADVETGAAVDVPQRQVEVRLPYRYFDPRGQRAVRVAAATGLWDVTTGTYRAQTAAAFFNVAFRFHEPPSPWRTTAQSAALTSRDLSPFFALVDFTRLAAGTDDDGNVPASGFTDRILVSAAEPQQGRGDAASRRPGCEPPCALQYAGRLQPYGLYVPPRAPPASGYGLTIDLHGCGQTHNIGMGTERQRQLSARATPTIVLTPEARGDCYWYFGQAGADVFEAWADVARRYPLDPERTTITGASMGGYGALRLAAAYPDLFARVAAVVPCPSAGIPWPGGVGVPGGRSRMLAPLLASLRSVPVMSWMTSDDHTCEYTGQLALMSRLEALHYRAVSLTFSGVGHTALATAALGDSGPLADFLGDVRADRDPARVSYVVTPATNEPAHGLAADHAYWLSDVTTGGTGEAGRIDVTSYGLGRSDPGPPAAVQAAGSLSSGLAFVASSRVGGDSLATTARPRLRVRATGVRRATVDATRAGTGCTPSLVTRTDTRLALRLDGCRTTYVVRQVCHPAAVFSVRAAMRPGEHRRSAGAVVGSRPLALRAGRARVNLRRRPHARVRTRVTGTDSHGRRWVRETTHRWCPVR